MTMQDFPPRGTAGAAGIISRNAHAAPKRTERSPGTGRPGYSAGVATGSASAGIVTGAASRRKRRHATRMSRNNLTQTFGSAKCDANSRFVSVGCQ